MRPFLLLLFAFAGGLTVSGIVANIYRLAAKKPQAPVTTWLHYGVMAVAGPSVLLENATRSFRKKECSRFAYGFAVALVAYWAFAIGLFVIDVSLAI